MIEVWSSGGGTQSCAIAVLIAQGVLPKPDFAVIADTGKEMPTTWTYLEQVVQPALRNIGLEIHRVKASEFASPWGRGVFATSGQLMVPAYSNLGGKASKLSAYCSGAWKSEVIDRWFSQVHGITRSKYRKWIGFSFDETTRILRMQSGKEWKSGLIRLPLVYDRILRRHEAINVVLKHGWTAPPDHAVTIAQIRAIESGRKFSAIIPTCLTKPSTWMSRFGFEILMSFCIAQSSRCARLISHKKRICSVHRAQAESAFYE